MLRDPVSGGPAPLMRLVALTVVVMMLALSAHPLIPLFRWVLALL